jgi:ribose transport system permease protein
MTSDSMPAAETSLRAASPVDRARLLGLLERFALPLLLVLVIGVFATLPATSSTFTSPENIRNVLGDQAVLGVLAIASILPLVVGHFDLSVGAQASITQIAVAAAMSRYGIPMVPAVAIGIVMGAAIGLVNGVLVAKVRVNALITTLGVATVIAGLISLYTKGTTIVSGISHDLIDLGQGDWLGIPRTTFFLLAVALLVAYVLGATVYGRRLRLVGSNPAAAQLVGLRLDRLVLSTFVFTGALAGVAGALLVARNGNANPASGNEYTLLAVAAAFLGATTIRPGQFNVLGTLVAIFFLAFSVNGLNLAGVEPWINDVFNGTALVVAVGLSAVFARQRQRGA